MTDRPIIMSTESVKAILDGKKTMTRRVIKPRKFSRSATAYMSCATGKPSMGDIQYEAEHPEKPNLPCPYGQVGDRLWVRESFRYIQGAYTGVHDFGVWYKAGGKYKWWRDNGNLMNYPVNEKNRPSIFMPRWASRITLEITEVRVERVQEIPLVDVKKEGISEINWYHFGSAIDAFRELWDSLNAKRGYGWEVNPWVWVISFKKEQKDE